MTRYIVTARYMFDYKGGADSFADSMEAGEGGYGKDAIAKEIWIDEVD